jgi:hypothetical protein
VNETEKEALLKEEYFFLQKAFEDFDLKSLTIKGWVTTGSAAAFILGVKWQEVATPTVVAVIAVSAVVWIIEAIWKLSQKAFSNRIRTIEAYFRSDKTVVKQDVFPLQIYNSWYEAYYADLPVYTYEIDMGLRNKGIQERFFKMLFRPSVFFPYLPIIAICLVVYPLLLL